MSPPKKPTPYLGLQQELSDLFEPEKVAHLFRRAAIESEIEEPTEAEAREDEEKVNAT